MVEQARIVDLYDGRVGGYFRDPSRDAPHNLYAHTSQLLAEASGASKAHDIGFRFGSAPSCGRPMTSFSVSYPAASFMFRWSAKDGRWLVWMDGAPARAVHVGQLGAPTVVIQYTNLKPDGQQPYAQSAGPEPDGCFAAARPTPCAGHGRMPTAALRSGPFPGSR